MRFVGYAIDHDMHAVFMLESDLANRQTVLDNAERCIEEKLGFQVVLCDIELHTARAGENIAEYAELLARDLVTGCDGLDDGYTFFDEPITVSKRERSARALCDELATYHNTSKSGMRRFFETWQMVHAEIDEQRAFSDFASFIERMRSEG